MPPELKRKKSIIITRVDDIIYDRSIDEIADELANENTLIGEEIDSIYKFPSSNTIKVTFNSTVIAKKVY